MSHAPGRGTNNDFGNGTSPIIAADTLYVRTESKLFAFKQAK